MEQLQVRQTKHQLVWRYKLLLILSDKLSTCLARQKETEVTYKRAGMHHWKSVISHCYWPAGFNQWKGTTKQYSVQCPHMHTQERYTK